MRRVVLLVVRGSFVELAGSFAGVRGAFVGPVRDPDLRPGTPTAPHGFLHGHELRARDCGPLTGAAPRSTPTSSVQVPRRTATPQLVSPSLAAGVFNKISVCVSECVGPVF